MIRLITGHICSGKSTWVRDHAAVGDIVIDCDRIAMAISAESTAAYEYSDGARELARSVRWSLVNAAATMHLHSRGGWDLWIIHAYPSETDVANYRRVGAIVREMQAEPEVLRRRAALERPERMQKVLDEMLAKVKC